jgi:hypothetical protein
LNDDTGVLATQNGMRGIAKAWANWNGFGGVTIGSSFNVSSITRVSSGIYTITFTTAMANANYVPAGMINNTTNMYGIYVNGGYSTSPTLKSTTQLQVTTVSNGGTVDDAEINVAIFGA